MITLKIIHMSSALISISGFIVRGLWMIKKSPLQTSRLVKIAPHVIDTVLLSSAVLLAVQMQLSPLNHPWLSAKIIALGIYIALGLIAFRFGKSQKTKIIAWLLAILSFGYIVSTAFSKNPSILSLGS